MAARTLLELARERFRDDWTQPDETLFRATAEGTEAKFGTGDPGESVKWGQDRVLKANRIEWLCTQPEAVERVTHSGVRIVGARIDEELELAGAQIGFLLILAKSAIPRGIDLQTSHLHVLSLCGSHVGPVCANQLQVVHGVYMGDGFHANGQVELRGAVIGGNLDLSGGTISNPGDKAFAGDGMTVRGAVFMRKGFRARGEVRFVGAQIDGNVECVGGHFSTEQKTEEKTEELMALNMAGMHVKGSVLLIYGFEAEGEVRLSGARIGGNLECTKASFQHADGRALNVERAEIAGHVFFREDVHVEGEVYFTATSIKGGFQWLRIATPENCSLILESARIGTLWDEKASWPKILRLDGLTYDRIDSQAPHDAAERLRWLGLQDYKAFVPQPYVQLAKVLQEMGHEEDARKILIAKLEDVVRVRNMTFWERIRHRVYGSTIAYGYRPWKALWWIGSFILLGTCLFEYGFRIQQFQQEGSGVVPAFNAIMYSVDTFVPLVDFHQAKYQLPVLWWLRYYHWFHIFVGWVLTSLFVVGLTGLVRK